MPKFELDKLVRDGLREKYQEHGQVVVYKELSPDELKRSLIKKIVEEATEINPSESIFDVTREISHVKQVLADLALVCGISEEQIYIVQQEEYENKGGFSGGTYVDTIELADGDEWVEYYRKRPDVFPEKK